MTGNSIAQWYLQGQALVQLAKKTANITLIGTASQLKHDQVKDSVNHLIDHTCDYVSEVRKYVTYGMDVRSFVMNQMNFFASRVVELLRMVLIWCLTVSVAMIPTKGTTC